MDANLWLLGVAVFMAVCGSEEGGKEWIVFTSTFINVEEDSINGIFFSAASLIGKGVDEVHLEVVELSVDSVLGGGVEVEL